MLELRKITKTYTAGELRQDALKDVSLTLRDCEFVSILGHSGSGKTTLLNIIGGLDQYTSGDLIIDGVSTKKYRDRDWDTYRNHTVGFVFQSYNLIPHQTVLANVELALTLSGVSKRERRKKAEDALRRVGLYEHRYKRPAQLSGGQMQRVAIARSLINDPKILLADEPTGALDTETSLQVMEILKEISHDRLVVMVTHNPELAETYSTRIIRLTDGKIIGDSDPSPSVGWDRSPVKRRKERRRSMSFATALSLSLNNLMTKKARTILTSFAGSIGIIGIALILSLSTGFQNYIDRVQEDTLSSYPLMLTTETADMSAMLAAFSGLGGEAQEIPDTVTEVQVMSQIFAQVGSNELSEFLHYYDANEAQLEDAVSAVQYSYGVTPQIYCFDRTGTLLQVNPSTLFASMMGGMGGMGAYTNTNVFSQMLDNPALLEEQYDVLAGRWPEAYNEMILVLLNPHSMSDYMVYALGLRDPAELERMIENVIEGEEPHPAGEPLDWTYDELMDLEFYLISAADRYVWNEEYEVYEDMSEDKGFMHTLVRNGEQLRIVGVVCPKSGVAATALSAGIAYTPELTEWVMQRSENAPIVAAQRANPDVDVFSGKTFEALEEEEGEGLNFDDMITVDSEMIQDAFGISFSEDYIPNLIKGYLTDISAAITTDTAPAATAFLNTLKALIEGMTAEYLAANTDPVTGVALLRASDADSVAGSYLAGADAGAKIAALTAAYGLPADALLQVYRPLLSGWVSGYAAAFAADPAVPEAVLTAAMAEPFTTGYLSSALILGTADTLAPTMTEAKMQLTILSAVGELSTELVESIAGAFQVDADKLAAAFRFNLDEEELTRLMRSYSGAGESRSYESNLRALGYADPETPYTVSFYFVDFEAKERFLDFLDGYNADMENAGHAEKVISYTDVTGLLMSSVKTMVDSVTYVLIAFVAISLVVSSIMIGVITYISVLERTKEIGILRAIGASRKDISRVFNAETVIVGLCAGLIGIGTSLLLIIPINALLFAVTGIATLKAALPSVGAVVLVVISVILTVIAGFIPSGIAARRNPVESLRSD